MYYDKYMEKINKLVKIRDIIYKFRYLILAIIVLILSTTFTLMGLKGNINGQIKLASNYVYGENYQPEAKAFLAKAEFEYLVDRKWVSKKPIMPGEYSVRAVTQNGFGKIKYSNVKKFSILKRQLNVSIANQVVYGNNPEVIVQNLVNGDKLQEQELNFKFNNILYSPSVILEEGSFAILNADGFEVTRAYEIPQDVFKVNSIKLLKRDLNVVTSSAQKIYDGTPLTSSDYEYEHELAYSDTLKVEINASQTNVGSCLNRAEITIFNQDNLDVTSLYNVNTNFGELSVLHREITINTLSASKTYDGEQLSAGYNLVEGTLAPNEKLLVSYQPAIVFVAKVENEIVFDIEDKYNSSTIDNYKITVNAGELQIIERPIHLTINKNSKTYDGKEYDILSHGYVLDKNYPLVYKDVFIGDINFVQINKPNVGRFVGEYAIELKGYSVTSPKHGDVTANYKITVTDGSLTVLKRIIYIESALSEYTKVYDDERMLSIMYNAYDCEYVKVNKKYSFADGEECFITVSMGEQVNVGRYENAITIIPQMFSNGEETTENYDVKGSYANKLALIIKARPIKIVLSDAVRPYTGKPFTSNEYQIVQEGNYLDIIAHHTLQIKTSGSIIEPSKVPNRITEVVIKNATSDVTNNYVISKGTGYLEVIKRQITVKPLSYTKIYDAKTIKYPNDMELMYAEWNDLNNLVYGTAIMEEHQVDCSIDYDKYSNVASGYVWIVGESFKIFDKYGRDISSKYYECTIEKNTTQIIPKQIVVSSMTIERTYDGTPLIGSSEDCYISMGTLVSGHTIEYTVSARLYSIGKTVNRIVKVVIKDNSNTVVGYAQYDKNGNLIAGNEEIYNYYIVVSCGELILN